MKTERMNKFVTVTNKGKKHLQQGHPWLYEGEVLATEDGIQDGDIVDVLTESNGYIGSGFYNHRSKIRVRIFSTNANDIYDESFWRRRLQHSYDYRKTVMGEDIQCCRLIFGEADYFPGFSVDRFQDLLVVQTLCLGIDQRKKLLYRLLLELLAEDGQQINGIYERNDVAIRKLEGMEEYKGWADGLPHPESVITHIIENGIRYQVDVENGQKTGFFLDQKYNRQAVARLTKDKMVLDCCTHTGSFALNAAKGGAKHVHALDISETAIAMAKQNAVDNAVDDVISFETEDIFTYLKGLKKSKQYDVIILDPPAFTKSRETIKHALKGYREINTLAMRALPRGGYLATCSCSHFMNEGLFKSMLHEAAQNAGVVLRQIEARTQSCDHPILWNVPETSYLKFFIFQVC